MARPPRRYEISVDFEGKEYRGSYTIQSKMVKVYSAMYGSKATQIGGLPPEEVARMLLHSILTDAKRKKLLKD